ncbi:nucleotidyltransferase [Candidatus Daviesbacteria bacterium]|nr:nucleotidyltransferase [Candidatus Daviesbacteria bacterium]
MITEDQLKIWATPPSAVKYIATRERIEKALIKKFGGNITVYLQGSYKNKTNTKSESDVDIVVEYTPAYYPGFFDMSAEQIAEYHRVTIKHDYTFSQFKLDVYKVLLDEFSDKEVKWHPKCIRVLKNENRVNADVVVCFTHQRYTDPYAFDAVGIHFFMDSGEEVVNFPVQHHKNGEDKNTETDGKFKDTVRIYKNIMQALVDSEKLKDEDAPSHFIESLVWNVSSPHFQGTYVEILKSVTGKVWHDMKLEKDPYNNYKKIHELEWLFKGNVVYTPIHAQTFMGKVWNFLEV